MPWYASVLLAVIPAVATGLFAWLIARSRDRAAIGRLSVELWYQRERDLHQRTREVKSEPLLAFRRELARMAQKYSAVVRAEQMQHTRFGITDEQARDILQRVAGDWNSYLDSGDYERAMFQLWDDDIVRMAENITEDLRDAYAKATDIKIVVKEMEGIREKILALQRLINQRLQEL